MSTHPSQAPGHDVEGNRKLIVRSVFVVLAAAMLLFVAYAAAHTGQAFQTGPVASAQQG